MIHLNVTLDASLLKHLQEGQWNGLQSAWVELCDAHSVGDLRDCGRFLKNHDQSDLNLGEVSLMQQTAGFLRANLQKSVQHISRWLPEIHEDITQSLTVVLLPYGQYTFSPKTGLQVFSLDPYADPLETYLFLVHVYYHELSSISDTCNGRRYSHRQSTSEDFKNWIKLLIRNEGLGNYAILPELVEFMEGHKGYQERYFSFARQIRDELVLKAAVHILTYAFKEVDDQNVTQFACGINKIFRQDRLSVLNLVGIHMAQSIASHYGNAILKNVHQRDAQEFFTLFGQTRSQFAEVLGSL